MENFRIADRCWEQASRDNDICRRNFVIRRSNNGCFRIANDQCCDRDRDDNCRERDRDRDDNCRERDRDRDDNCRECDRDRDDNCRERERDRDDNCRERERDRGNNCCDCDRDTRRTENRCRERSGHKHEVQGSVRVVAPGCEAHNHRFATVSSDEIVMGNTHVHDVRFSTDTYDEHEHEFCGRTGPAVYIGTGHVHYLNGTTTSEREHRHTFKVITHIEDPTGN